MFAGNGKISPYQVSCLLFVDWVGKLLLLLPRIRGPLAGWDFIAAVALGGIWTFLYLVLLTRLSARIQGSFTGFLRERLGKYPAYLAGALFLLYLLINLTYLARTVGRICRLFLLPEVSETWIAVCALAAGAATAFGDSQKRGRTAEFLFYPVAIALAVMLAASAGSVSVRHFAPAGDVHTLQILYRSGAVFAGFSGVTLILYEMPHTNWAGRKKLAALGRGFCVTFLFLLAAFLAVLGVLGRGSLLRLPWPVLTLMSSASVPGGFLQRWDAVFLAFLLFSLLLACGTSSHYMKRVLSELRPGKNREGLLLAAILPALAAVFLTGSFETAAAIFYRFSLCCLIPLMTAIPVILIILERIKKKCEG